MTIPMEVQHATDAFERFLASARDRSGLTTRNQTYTMVDGVLRVFRRRLTAAEGIRFAGVLPPLVRAMFVAGWDPDEPRLPFADRATLTREVQALREHHNFAPDSAIADTAAALRGEVDQSAFDAVLATISAEAVAFWRV